MGKERNRSADSRIENGNGGNSGAVGKSKPENKDEQIIGNATGRNATGGNGDAPETGRIGTTGNGTEKPATGKADAPNNAAINPADLVPDEYARDENGNIKYKADGVTPQKKRGRKPGSLNSRATSAPKSRPAKTDAARAAVATEMLAAQFQILNTGIAFLTKFDDFKLDDEEASQMAEATANVLAQFDYVPDPKVAAVMGLVTTTSMIYGPRVYLYRSHIKKIAEEKKRAKIARADNTAALNNEGFSGPNMMGQFSG